MCAILEEVPRPFLVDLRSPFLIADGGIAIGQPGLKAPSFAAGVHERG